MKNQALFSLKDKSKKIKCRLLQFLFDALRINVLSAWFIHWKEILVSFLLLLSWTMAYLKWIKK